MTDTRMVNETAPLTRMTGLLPIAETPIVPKNSISGRALVAVVAIMTFLSAVTAGAVMQIRSSAAEWQSAVAREITIQVRPVEGKDAEADVRTAAELARTFPGIVEARPYSKEESAKLLEPWLGSGLALNELPVPRIIVVRQAAGTTADLTQLRKLLTERVPSASLDDHRAWIEHMRTMANSAVMGGLVVLLLILAATVMSVTFATRGAMATNREIVEVLHFVGAKDGFIASQFQRHFLVLGLEGGIIGGGLAILLFLVVSILGRWGSGTAAGEQFAALFGSLELGIEGYVAIVAVIILLAGVTALASRRTVRLTLKAVD